MRKKRETASSLIKKPLKRILWPFLLRRRIESAAVASGGKLKIVFGGHWAELKDWLILSEEEQDVTKPLGFSSDSADVVFTEHVIEHVGCGEGIRFMREALRILKKGGVFRVVCPVTEKLLAFSAAGDRDRQYLACLDRVYPAEKKIFAELGFEGLAEFPQVFLLNSLFTGHGHRFIWSAALLSKVLSSLGYSSVEILGPGEGVNPDYCLERRRRGVYTGADPAEDRAPGWVYDAESLVVEAVK